MQIIGYAVLLLVGLSLGLLGGGGGILAVPILTEFFGFSIKEAVPISLLLVGISSLYGAVYSLIKKEASLNSALPFLLTSIIGAFLGAKLAQFIPENIQVICFAALLLISGILLLNKKEKNSKIPSNVIKNKKLVFIKLIVSGLFVGILTGILGVGGGFLIVPALIIILNMEAKTAIATSLVIICLNSLFATASYAYLWMIRPGSDISISQLTLEVSIQETPPYDFLQIFYFVILVIIGMIVGLQLKKKAKGAVLQKIFSIIMLLVSIQMFVKMITKFW